ncbi:hypothetical protein B0H63DRAFT_117997 [Podospora didyma]|uniref:Bul1 C-terminal domain-containing protein n=1 Tax=Podospora didyma TaxID=330526 RepID=A0AAE0U4B5_9PEZI|nr:hypothetical protein B0H63DRAFT_117997 [Podospora didyma]
MSFASALHSQPAARSITTSNASDAADFPGHTKKMVYPKSNIEVNLKDHFRSRVYTSSSPIAGDVTITTKRDVRFDSIQILLVGNTKTKVDGVNSMNEVTHTFLKMVMPIPESTYPVPRVLETGRTYTIPFNFVIPNQLTINACNHERLSDQLQDQHVLLPPSMGQWEKDDMAPIMARVDYTIKARVLRQPDLGGRMIRIMEATQAINVLPASAVEPPLNITEKDQLYKMSKTKALRKNLLTTKLGHLTAEALQPAPAVLRYDGLGMVSHPTARVNLKFDPVSPDVSPPKISKVSGKITAHTYYSSGTVTGFPNLGEWNQPYNLEKRGVYSTSAPLPSISVAQPKWAPQLTSPTRRDSGYSSNSNGTSEGSCESEAPVVINSKKSSVAKKTAASPVFHTATLDVPFRLPVDLKTFLPTFHSCITSRVYTLHLSVSVGIGSATSTITLTVPLQVAIEYNSEHHSQGGLPSFETAMAEAEADDHMRPRVLQVPDYEFRETSQLPGYGSAIATRR